MKRAVLLLTVVAIVFSSCYKVVGTGPVVTEMRPVSNFTGVSSSISAKVNFMVDPVFKVEVRAQDNILDVLQTKVVNGVLEISFKNGAIVKTNKEITVNVSAPTADFFRLSGSGNMDVNGNLITNNLEINVSGSGNISVQQASVVDQIESRVSGSGGVKIITGTAKNEDLSVSGSGGIDLSEVQAEKATTHISGSGNVKVRLSQSLDAHISGSGSVRYYGNPVISTEISGSGRVVPL
jgi:uncharacterized protein YxjI